MRPALSNKLHPCNLQIKDLDSNKRYNVEKLGMGQGFNI